MINKSFHSDMLAESCCYRMLDVILLSQDMPLLSLLSQTLREFEILLQDGALQKIWLHRTSTIWEFSAFLERCYGSCLLLVDIGSGNWEVWSDLCRLRTQLDARFILCRPSAVANIRHVHRIDLRARTLYFPYGFSCGFSKSNKNAVIRAFEYMYQGGTSTWQTI